MFPVVMNRTQPVIHPMLLCSKCGKTTLHVFNHKQHLHVLFAGGTKDPLTDKERAKAGMMLAHYFRCTVCGAHRIWGNEIELGKKPQVNRNYIKNRKSHHKSDHKIVNPPLNTRKGTHLDGN